MTDLLESLHDGWTAQIQEIIEGLQLNDLEQAAHLQLCKDELGKRFAAFKHDILVVCYALGKSIKVHTDSANLIGCTFSRTCSHRKVPRV